MAKSTKETKKQTRRTQVKELPRSEEELSKAEQKKIKGGPQSVTFFPSVGRTDGSSN
jgi:hypothetical protein